MRITGVKTKIVNQIMVNGAKSTSEKILINAFKKLQKTTFKKNGLGIVKLSLAKSSPIFFIKTIKRKRKRTIEFPFILKPNLRLSYGIKILTSLDKIKNTKEFYKKFTQELLQSSQNVSKSVVKKEFLHKEAFAKKKFSNYRWF